MSGKSNCCCGENRICPTHGATPISPRCEDCDPAFLECWIDGGNCRKRKADSAELFARFESVANEVFAELRRAIKKHPAFPIDAMHAGAIVAEESGELSRAIIDATYFGGSGAKARSECRDEAVQVAASAIRFLLNFENIQFFKSRQIVSGL